MPRPKRLRRDLRPVVLALRGDPKDPGHVNLPARLNWLTIQVGNNSGAPTAAQMEWIGTFAEQAASAIAKLEEIKRRSSAPGSSIRMAPDQVWHEGPGFSRGNLEVYCCRGIVAAPATGFAARTAFFARPRSINSDSLT